MSDVNTLNTVQPLEQLPDETDTTYDRFITYMKMGGDRSSTKVVQKYDKKESYKNQLGKWSKRYNWVERVKAYDRYLVRKSLKNKEDILDYGKGRLLKMVDQALDQLEEVLMVDDVLLVGEGVTSLVGQKIKVAESVLDRAEVDKLKDVAEEDDNTTEFNTFYQMNYYRIQTRPKIP